MRWEEIVDRYPSQWMLVEAMEAHSEGGKRHIHLLQVLETFPDSTTAFRQYQTSHRERPDAELYVVHSARKKLEIDDVIYQGMKDLL